MSAFTTAVAQAVAQGQAIQRPDWAGKIRTTYVIPDGNGGWVESTRQLSTGEVGAMDWRVVPPNGNHQP